MIIKCYVVYLYIQYYTILHMESLITAKISSRLLDRAKKYIGDGKRHSTQQNLLNRALQEYLIRLQSEEARKDWTNTKT